VLDDRSRLACQVQWYLRDENAEDLVHGPAQAIQKRGLRRALMTDNGPGGDGGRGRAGVARLGGAARDHARAQPASERETGALLDGPLTDGAVERVSRSTPG